MPYHRRCHRENDGTESRPGMHIFERIRDQALAVPFEDVQGELALTNYTRLASVFVSCLFIDLVLCIPKVLVSKRTVDFGPDPCGED